MDTEKKKAALAAALLLWGITEQQLEQAHVTETKLYMSLGNAGRHWERGAWRPHVPEWVKSIQEGV